jgi:hypothetical protein
MELRSSSFRGVRHYPTQKGGNRQCLARLKGKAPQNPVAPLTHYGLRTMTNLLLGFVYLDSVVTVAAKRSVL